MTDEDDDFTPEQVLRQRMEDAFDQMERYGGLIFNEELMLVWEALTDINDDLHHMRSPAVIREQVEKAKALLEAVAVQAESR